MLKNVALAASVALVTSTGLVHASATASITEAQVTELQRAWGQGIIEIGAVYTDGGDYEAAAREHIERFYAYGEENVLFKPTLASENQFRGTFDEALSYFVTGIVSEDTGFAIAPFTDVRWENEATSIDSDSALSMGNYYFTKPDGTEVKVEYSFGMQKMESGDLKIVLHHSSLPYSPN